MSASTPTPADLPAHGKPSPVEPPVPPAATPAAYDALTERLSSRPRRVDALRNYEKILAAARDAFTAGGATASLEDIARRAEVGIGTLYRHFPTRQALLEAVYVDEVKELALAAENVQGLDPWEALERWLRRFVGYLSTKQALAQELLEFMERDAPLFRECKLLIFGGATPLLEAAQASGAARADVDVQEIAQMMMGIARIPSTDPATVDRILGIALDGLRFQRSL